MIENSTGKLFVISAPSAAGKTTIIKRLITSMDGSLSKVVTCTTRKARQDEEEGIDYYFISEEEYKKHLDNNDFVESAKVYGNLYGVLRSEFEKIGHKVISLDSKGVESLKKEGVNACYILIAPPSLEVLKERLKRRDTESSSEIELRIAAAEKELSQKDLFDKVVVNDNLDEAIKACKKIIIGEIDNEKTK